MEHSNIIENFVEFKMGKIHPLDAQTIPGFRKKKVTLLASPWVFQGEPEFQSQQLGLAYIGAYIEESGHEIISYIDPMLYGGMQVMEPFDTEYQKIFRVGHTDEWIMNHIPKETDYIFINVPFTDSRFVFYPLCSKIRQRFPDMMIVIGGILATTLSHQIIRETGADIVVKGEGEIAAARILNGEPLNQIPGVVFKTKDGIVENNGRSEQLSTIDDIPWITRHEFRPMDEYVKWSPRGNQKDRTFSYITSRGCPFTCEFCSIPEKGQRWRSFSPDRVVSEIKFMIDKYDISNLEIEDDNFTLKAKHSLPILQYLKDLKQSGHGLIPSFPNGLMIDRLDREHIFMLRDAGTDAVYLPVESGDLKNLIAMNKPVALEHLDKTLEVAGWCAEAGLQVGAFFIIGYPGGRVFKKDLKEIIYRDYKYSILEDDGTTLFITGEDEASFEETCRYAKKLLDVGVTYVTPLIATPYPGTALYDICEKYGWLRRKDHSKMVTTISYQNPKEEFINIDTPWASSSKIFERWSEMGNLFSTRHNVIKK